MEVSGWTNLPQARPVSRFPIHRLPLPRTPAGNAGWWLLTAGAILATFGSFAAMALAYPETLR